MGLFDFFKKGEEKPAQPQTSANNDFFKTNSASQPTAAQPVTTEKEYYTVKSGDSLSKIAKQLYGNASEWHKIHQANTDQIKDPDLIHPGQKFVIPR